MPVNRQQQLFLLAAHKGKNTPGEQAKFVWDTLASQGQRVIKEGKVLEIPTKIWRSCRSKRKNLLKSVHPFSKRWGSHYREGPAIPFGPIPARPPHGGHLGGGGRAPMASHRERRRRKSSRQQTRARDGSGASRRLAMRSSATSRSCRSSSISTPWSAGCAPWACRGRSSASTWSRKLS